MFHVYIKSIVECLQRHPEVRAQDITVACFGGALQMHVPHCVALLGPNISWELWRENGKFAPLFQEHLSKKVEQRVGTRAQYLLSLRARPERRFICLVDIDYTPEHAFRKNNQTGVKPSVDTENHFYESFTRPYANLCRLAASIPNVLVVSVPFRAPWCTDDYATNKGRALWTQPDETMLHPQVDTFVQYNARPRSNEMRALCWCSGTGVREDAVDWKQMDLDMAAYNARRLFRDHDQLLDLLRQYAACTSSRADLFEHESSALGAWRTAFVQNTMAFADEDRAHAAQAALAAQEGGADRPSKRLRFCDGA